MKRDWKVGDTVYCYSGNHQGKLSEGKIVSFLDLEGYSYRQYVIAIPTGVDDLLVVRDALTMADKKDGQIGFWEMARKRYKKSKETL